MSRNVLLPLLALVSAGLLWLLFRGPDDGGTTDPGAADPSARVSEVADPVAGESTVADLGDGGLEAARSALAQADADEVAAAARARDAGALRLRLTDAKKQALRGLVVEARYERGFRSMPMIDMSVLSGITGLSGHDRETVQAATGSDGWVTLAGLAPGEPITLAVSGDYWARESWQVAPLLPQERRNLGERSLSPGVKLTGTVRGPNGSPRAGATVALSAGTGNFVFSSGASFHGARTATTDAGGRYELTGVEPGSYTAKASASGALDRVQNVELGMSQPDAVLDLDLPRGGSVRGRVVDADGRGVPGASVVLAESQGMAMLQWSRQRVLSEGATADASGAFQLDGLPEQGSFRVLATAAGHALARSGGVSPGAEVEIALEPTASLTGTVVDSDGAPVAGASVSVNRNRGSGMGGPIRIGGAFGRNSVDTDDAGRFAFADLELGTYELRATSPTGAATLEELEIALENEALEVELRGGAALVVRLREPNGAPVVGVEVSVRRDPMRSISESGDGTRRSIRMVGDPGGSRRGTPTDRNGEVRFFGLEPGEWIVAAKPDGAVPVDEVVERLDSDEEQRHEVVVVPESMLRLTVVDGAGLPVAGTAIDLNPVDVAVGGKKQTRHSDDWGVAVFDGLAPGLYAIQEGAGAPGAVMFSSGGTMSYSFSTLGGGQEETSDAPAQEIEIAAASVIEEQFVIAAKAILNVTVTRYGQPVPGATVELAKKADDGNIHVLGMPGGSMAGMGNSVGSAESDAEGIATLPPVEPGEYVLRGRRRPSSPTTEMEVTLGSGNQELQLDLSTGILRGTVMEEGAPVSGAQVSLAKATEGGGARTGVMAMVVTAGGDDEPAFESMDFLPGQTTVNTGSDGRFQFEDLPQGEYVLRVAAPGYTRLDVDAFGHDGQSDMDLGVQFLTKGGMVRGKVLNLPGQSDLESVPSLHILTLVEAEDDQRVTASGVRGSGDYRFKDVKPGRYKLRMNVGGEERLSTVFEIRSGETTEFDFVLD